MATPKPKPQLIVDIGEPRTHPWRDRLLGTAEGCKQCGKRHYNCAGHKRKQPDTPCGQNPMKGQRTCWLHGGKSKQAMATGRKRTQRAEAIELLGTLQFVVRKGTTVEQLQVAMDEAAWWADQRRKDVEKLNGKLVVEETDRLGAHKLAVHPSVTLYTEALDRVDKYMVVRAKLGLEDRRLQLVKEQGDRIFGAFTRALETADLSPEQSEMMRVAFANGLRNQGELAA